MENKILVNSNKDPLLTKNRKCYLNLNNECIICSQSFDSMFILINNLCKCYDAVKICRTCFIKWISNNNECFLCRKKYNINSNNALNIYHSNNNEIIEIIQNINNNYIIVDINENNSENDLILLNNRDLFTTCKTFRLWCSKYKYNIIRHILCYSFIITFFISIKKTLDYEKMNYNNTNSIIL